MSITRRGFLQLSAGLALSAQPLTRLFAADRTQRLLTCRADAEGSYFLSHISEQGKVLFDTRLPARGHGVCVHAAKYVCAVFARRPGDFLWIVDLRDGSVLHRIASPEHRHFNGHGVFNPDSGLLFTTENAFDRGAGVIGVYDGNDSYRRLGELSSHGIDPHELQFLSNHTTLAVANGGILTHPEYDRVKLNLDEMRPNLAYIDISNGKLLASYEPPAPWHQLSIRHLDIDSRDQVFIAMQYEGAVGMHPPLLARHRGETSLQLLTAPDDVQKRLRNYCGSICLDRSGQVVAASHPPGNLITLWSATDGGFLQALNFPDCGGLAEDLTEGCFSASNGAGTLARLRYPGVSHPQTFVHLPDFRWDNHLLAYQPA